METAELKNYLKEVLRCEQALFTAEQIKNDINKNINITSRMHESVKIPKYHEVAPDSEIKDYDISVGFIVGLFIAITVVSIVAGFVIGAIAGFLGFSSNPDGLWLNISLFGVIACVIVIIIYVVGKISGENIRIEEIKKHNEEIIIKNEENKKNHKSALKLAQNQLNSVKETQSLIIAELNDKRDETDNFINDTKKTLETLYSLDIVFGKYRHIVAVASFCEYIISGRCDGLEGADGAYNLYESELRQNIILGQLDAVIKGLQQIRDAQYMLYEAINESNRIMQNIAYEMNSMSGEIRGLKGAVNEVEKSSAMTAYFTEQTAKNSKLLVDIERKYGALYDKSGFRIWE